MSVLYGKVRLYTDAGQDITITDGKGNTKTVQTTGQEFTDIALPGMEEYTLSNDNHSADVLLNIGDFKEVNLPYIPASLENASWNYISKSIKNGTFGQYASVGDTKSFNIGSKTYHAEVVAINNGVTGGASWYPDKTVDFITKELYETTYYYNNTSTNTGGFPSSTIRTTLNNTVYPLLPLDLKDVIIEKSHSYQAGNRSGSSWSSSMVTSVDKLWLPTYFEIAGVTNTNAPGETSSNNRGYTLYTTIKNINDINTKWWLGSPCTANNSNIWLVLGTGNLNNIAAAYEKNGVPICFRIG